MSTETERRLRRSFRIKTTVSGEVPCKVEDYSSESEDERIREELQE